MIKQIPVNKLLAEALGTFCIVFLGTGAIVVNQMTGGSITHLGVAMAFGLVVMVMIYAFGDVSGAHLNPAVSVAFALAGRFPGRDVAGYAAAQTVGAFAGTILVRVIFPESPTLGGTAPSGSALQSFVLEVALAFLLMLVILSVSSGSKEKGVMAGVAVGGMIALEAVFAGPISGASMNPVRSLAPAVVGWRWDGLWIYLIAPMVGMALAVPCSLVVNRR